MLVNLKKHYQTISEEMGCSVNPLEGYLNAWAWGLGIAERDGLANDLFNYNIELYPERPAVYNSFGNYLRRNEMTKEALAQFEKLLSLRHDREILTIKNELLEEMRDSYK